MKIIGITGSIGCGKTTFASMIKKLGYEVFDADNEVAKIYENEVFLNCLKNEFPNVFENNLVNKKLLRNIVFGNKNELLRLENIVEPFLQKVFMDKINKVKEEKGTLFIDAVLLFEKGWNKFCNKIICVTVDFNTQKQRVMIRDNISEVDFNNIYNLQMNNKLKCEMSDIIVDTDCSLLELEEKAKNIVRTL